MTPTQQIITVALAVAATLVTRFLPFLIFPKDKPTPPYVDYLGRVLPAAVFALLVVYSLREVSWTTGLHGAPELIALALVVALHLRWRNMLLSIAGGTVCYMLLVQLVFV